jgi:triacylglycerol lipase
MGEVSAGGGGGVSFMGGFFGGGVSSAPSGGGGTGTSGISGPRATLSSAAGRRTESSGRPMGTQPTRLMQAPRVIPRDNRFLSRRMRNPFRRWTDCPAGRSMPGLGGVLYRNASGKDRRTGTVVECGDGADSRQRAKPRGMRVKGQRPWNTIGHALVDFLHPPNRPGVMKYTYPAAFDVARAQELGKLIDAAYDQLDQGLAWKPPAGYTMLTWLSAKEVWKLPPPATSLMETLLKPAFPWVIGGLLENLLKPVPFGFVARKGDDVYVVLRSTRTPLEWLSDFTVPPTPFQPAGQSWGNTTKGFKAIYDDLGPQIHQALIAFQSGGGVVRSVLVTGHSLGAALAHLAAAGIAAEFKLKPVSYTFCGPRAGDADFATAFATAGLQTWRVFNTEDIVPTVPPASAKMAVPDLGIPSLTHFTESVVQFVQLSPMGYQHVGYPIAATFHRDSVSGNHDLDTLCAEIAKE